LFIARPTFPRYFLLTVPFMAIVAAVGLRALSQRLSSPERIWWTAGTACLLMVIGLTRTVYDGRDDFAWRNFEKIAAKVQAVTPAGASLYADEALYFMLRRTPPPGFEYDDSHKLKDLPPAEAALLHIVPSPERDRMVKEGAFHTAQSCDDDEMKKLEPFYANQWEHEGCGVYWDFK